MPSAPAYLPGLPSPYSFFLAVHAIPHGDLCVIVASVALFIALQNVDDMLRGAVVRAARRPAVSSTDFAVCQPAPVHNRRNPVVRLDVVGRPTEVTRRNEARI